MKSERILSQPLTDHNGVVCYKCFRTINLTEANKELAQKKSGWLRAMMGTSTEYPIHVVCPYCQRKVRYDYNEVHPISPPASEIEKLRQERDQALADAKLLAQELDLEKKKHPQEESEEPEERFPPLAKAPKQPEPPEKKQAPGVY